MTLMVPFLAVRWHDDDHGDVGGLHDEAGH
jgi:hypothetical protein